MMLKILFVISFLLQGNLAVCGGKKHPTTNDYVKAIKIVTDVMVNDVTSPVAASRYYAYVTLTSYETQSLFDTVNYPSLSGNLNRFKINNISTSLLNGVNQPLAIILAVFKSAEKLLPSGYLLKGSIDSLERSYATSGESQLLFKNTATLVDEVVKQVMGYVKADGFSKLNNLARYTPRVNEGYWKPTPPVFMAPVEPNWNKLRTFILDSAEQFKVALPAKYDTAKTSVFFIQLMEVYNVTNKMDGPAKSIAMFWDCNPFAVQQIGHVEYGLKKISPGGHWVGITGIACKKKNYPLNKTAMVHALVSIALADAFIACWDEKYRSDRVRPETVIQRTLDPNWRPLLQTPPFPEYVSGHSVASTTAAVILTYIFGDHFTYADNTEVEFGLPVKKYNSFLQASSEAAISRLYGGIHFRDAIEQGVWMGRKVGEQVLNKLNKYFGNL